MMDLLEKADDLRSAIVTLLKKNQQIGMQCDLSCHPTIDGLYVVDYFFCSETVDLLHLTAEEKKILMEEEELIEIFDTPEAAADFYLRLTGGKLDICSDQFHTNGHNHGKRTLKDKVLAYDKDKYF